MSMKARLLPAIAVAALVAAIIPLVPCARASAAPSRVSISAVATKGTTATVTVKRVNGAKKYQYMASTSKKFDTTWYNATKTVNSKKTKASIKGLRSGEKYYFKVRAKGAGSSKKAWGKWSKLKSKTMPKGYITITYKLRGGTLPKGAKTKVKQGQRAYILPEPTRKGYTFRGWSFYENHDWYEITSISYSSWNIEQYGKKVTLYAQWEPKATIHYVTNGGTMPMNTLYEVTFDDYSLPDPQRDEAGYKFLGWYTDPSFKESTRVTEVSRKNGEVTVYAKWAAPHTITYVLNGGTLPKDARSMITYDYSSDEGSYDLPTPTRSTYAFRGWYTDPNFTESSKIKFVMYKEGDVTVYAKWAAPRTITYELNGGTLPKNAKSLLEASSYYSDDDIDDDDDDTEYELPEPTRDGYYFQGWFTDPAFTEKSYVTRIKYSDGDVTVYAKWAAPHTITYELNGGALPDDAEYQVKPSYYDGESWRNQDYILPTPEKKNSTFLGWYTGPSFDEDTEIDEVKYSDGDVTVYAKWADPVTITYELGGGTLPEGAKTELTYESAYYNEVDYYDLPTPTKEGYVFYGWYTDPDLTQRISDVSYRNGNVTVYAKWAAPHAITYEINGGTLPGDAKTIVDPPAYYDEEGGWYYADDDPYYLPTPSRDGYTFQGWYTDASFAEGTQVTSVRYADGNVTVYAKWAATTTTGA